MGAVYFYHLTRTPLEQTLPALLGKALAAGWRVALRGPDAAMLDWLDEKLWLAGAEGFLPHGRVGGEFDADQPILLTDCADSPNRASCIMTIGGAEVSADEVGTMDRVCVLFDGNDPAAVEDARNRWRSLTDAGCAAQYWSQESGNWQKKAESG